MARTNPDRNLLLGILAIEHQFIARETLLRALNNWVANRAKPLGQILLEQKDITPEGHARLEALVAEYLVAGDGAEKSISSFQSLHPELHNKLQELSSAPDESHETLAPTLPPPPSKATDGGAPVHPTLNQVAPSPSATPIHEPVPTNHPATSPPQSDSQPWQFEATVSRSGTPPASAGEVQTRPQESKPYGATGSQEVDQFSATRSHSDQFPSYGARPSAPSVAAPTGSRFRIVRPLARGGLGEVFIARDQELNREVALKEIQHQWADHSESRIRFLLEAEITGGLEHPSIVPVYGLGTYPDGRPYYAMRFIRGDSLKEAIERFHKAEQPGRDPKERNLALRGLLERFIASCQAIAYAHSRGILHRDLKPGNIMIGPYGETLVVDWGLAKPVDLPETSVSMEGSLKPSSYSGTTPTLMGSAIGTPQYMSPEQAAGQLNVLGPATDIYSLGATLFCLLTGKPPIGGKTLNDILERVQKGDFPRPRELKPDTPPALEAVTLKAMATRPEERYATALDLVEDLKNWLADEPVSVYREPWTERAARWARRNRTKVVSTGVGALVLITSLAVGMTLVKLEQLRTEEQRRRASENFAQALTTMDRMLIALGETEVPDPASLSEERKKLLAFANEFYEKFVAEQAADPAVRKELGRAYGRLGDIQTMLARHAEAEKAYGQAVGVLEALAREFPDQPEYRRELARCQNNLGIPLKRMNRFADAEKSFRAAQTQRQALADASPEPAYKREAADSTYQLAALLDKLSGRQEEAEAAYQSGEALLKQLPRGDGGDGNVYALARNLRNHANLLVRSNRPDQARKQYEEAAAHFEDLVRRWPTVPAYRWELARAYNGQGIVALSAEDPPAALKWFAASAREMARLSADFPTVAEYRKELVLAQTNRLDAMREAGQRVDAAAVIAQVELTYRDLIDNLAGMVKSYPLVPSYRHELAVLRVELAILSHQSGRVREAEYFYRLGLADQRQLTGASAAVTEYRGEQGRILFNLAHLLLERGAVAEVAQATFLTPGQPLHALAPLRLAREEANEARAALNEATTELRTALKFKPADNTYAGYLRQVHNESARAALWLGRHDEAAQAAEQLPRVEPPDRGRLDLWYVIALQHLADAVRAAHDDARLGADARRRAADEYTRQATALLREAAGRGATRLEALFAPDLQPLRDSKEFDDLLKEVWARIQKRVG